MLLKTRAIDDLNKTKLYYEDVLLFSKEDGLKPDKNYINRILLANNLDYAIIIGDNKIEDKIDLYNIKSIIIKQKLN